MTFQVIVKIKKEELAYFLLSPSFGQENFISGTYPQYEAFVYIYDQIIRQKENNEIPECIFLLSLFTSNITYTDAGWDPC